MPGSRTMRSMVRPPMVRRLMDPPLIDRPLTATAGAAFGAGRYFHAGPISRKPRTRLTADTM